MKYFALAIDGMCFSAQNYAVLHNSEFKYLGQERCENDVPIAVIVMFL